MHQQFGVGADRDFVAVVHHHDAIGLQHGRQPMRDDDGGAALHEFLERLLHQPLGFRIQRTGGLVEQQNRRILEDGARQRDALALAARQPRAALAEECVVALRQLAQKFIGGRGDRGRLDLRIARRRAAVADILARAGAEQHRFLRHQADLRAQVFRPQIREPPIVDQHPSGIRIVEAQQQLEGRALAGARRSDERDGFARRHIQAEIDERGVLRPRRIVESDVVEMNRAAHPRRQIERLRRRADDGPRLEQLGQSLHGAGGALDLAPHLGQRGGRTADEGGVHQKLRQLPAGHGAGQHLARTQPQHERDAAEHQHDADRGERRAHPGAAHRSDEAVLHRLA